MTSAPVAAGSAPQQKIIPGRPAVEGADEDEAPAELTPGLVPRHVVVDLPPGALGTRPPRTPKVATALHELSRIFAAEGPGSAAAYARRHGIGFRDGFVSVRVDTGLAIRGVRLRDASSRLIVDEVIADLDAYGARVRNVFGPHIEAWVPVAAIDQLEARPTVRGVRKPWRMRSTVTSEGRAVIGADQWDGVAFRAPADGLQVGVIDLGFKGFEALQGRELPAQDKLFTRSFRDDDDLEADSEHGTAVAEIIFDIEPGATMYLANIETIGDINQAMSYLIENDVDVINMSLGCVGCAPGDGTGAAVEVVERGPQAGIPFVTSAGNDANKHWIGDFADADADGFHEWSPGDETNSFTALAGDEVAITINWDFASWFASAQDFDLLLLDSQFNIVDQSRDRQGGLPGQSATEEIVITLPFADTFHILIERVDATSPETLELYVDRPGLQYVVAEQSLSVPADGRRIIAVGAVHWGSDQPEAFSARGPTKDGRIKPDIGAPDGVSTVSFGPMNFFGTSAAAPHVVGAVALLHGRLGAITAAEAYSVLLSRVLDVPPVGMDNITGVGRLSLLPPR